MKKVKGFRVIIKIEKGDFWGEIRRVETTIDIFLKDIKKQNGGWGNNINFFDFKETLIL